jgi:hypothetical protein
MNWNKMQKIDAAFKGAVTIHRIPACTDTDNNRNYHQFLAVDPGEKNLARRCERHTYDHINQITYVHTKLWDVVDYTEDVSSLYYNSLNDLEKQKELIRDCTHIGIERQLPQSYGAVRMSQHCLTKIMSILCEQPLDHDVYLFEIASCTKTKKLNAPKGMSDHYVKKWSVDRCIEQLKLRNFTDELNLINNRFVLKKDKWELKQDDLADTFNYVETIVKQLKIPQYPNKIYTSYLTPTISTNANISSGNLIFNIDETLKPEGLSNSSSPPSALNPSENSFTSVSSNIKFNISP